MFSKIVGGCISGPRHWVTVRLVLFVILNSLLHIVMILKC